MSSYPASKRVLDLSISVPLLVVLSPLFAFLFAAMSVDMVRCSRDRGPWLYRETRISRGREFGLLKFRTLRRDVLASMPEESHARMLEADATNLTWAGHRLLKPWYFDELPQLWNVLRGDMSLVGPRPWPPAMVEMQVARGLTYRNELVAGWTGPAQVEKGVVEPAGYAELDVGYFEALRACSGLRAMAVDLRILRRTLAVLAKGQGLQY